MSNATNTTIPFATNVVDLVVYGIVADLLVIVPILFYTLLNGTNNYSKYHQTMVNMMTSAWAPLGICWIIVLANDSKMAREALTGSLEMAALGPFALQWVGLLAFMMAAHAGEALGAWENTFFAVFYFFLNLILIVLHWYLAPGIYLWIDLTPYPEREILRQVAEAKMRELAIQQKEAIEMSYIDGELLPDNKITRMREPMLMTTQLADDEMQ